MNRMLVKFKDEAVIDRDCGLRYCVNENTQIEKTVFGSFLCTSFMKLILSIVFVYFGYFC